MSGERYTITMVSAGGSDVPVVNRLRRFLKMALRAYKLKCVEIRADAELVPRGPAQMPKTPEKQ